MSLSTGPRQPVSGSEITLRQYVFDHLYLILNCRELLGKIHDSVAQLAKLGDRSVRKIVVIIHHLCKV